jgi:Fe-S-cluster-containing dehydrogenase component
MARYGMLINTANCVGCHACRIACQNQNGLLADETFIKFKDAENGNYPTVRTETIPMQCMQCMDAPCVAVCPTGASAVDDRGIVRVDEDKCIGCRYCMAACPYSARVVNSQTGTVDKCRLCVADNQDSDHATDCVNACPAHVRIFGDLDDPDSEVSKAIAETNAQKLAPLMSDANFYYVR